jgi:hypothetical protein
VADITHPIHDDDHLAAQLAAREAASRQDAAVLAPLRSEAAARALGLQLPRPAPSHDDQVVVIPDPAEALPPPPPPAPVAEPLDLTPVAVGAGSVSFDGHEPTSPPPPPPSPGPWPMPLADSDPRPHQDHRAAGDRPVGVPPPGVVVPTGGPARVTTGVLAAAAAQRPKHEVPVMELRPTVLATDIDRIGDQLVVMKDRLELRDRHNGLRRTLALAAISDVQVQRRLTSAVLVVSTGNATDLVIKGLRPEAAEAAREAILELRSVDIPTPAQIDERALMRAIVELHRAGVLDDTELAEKTALVARMAGRAPRV